MYRSTKDYHFIRDVAEKVGHEDPKRAVGRPAEVHLSQREAASGDLLITVRIEG